MRFLLDNQIPLTHFILIIGMRSLVHKTYKKERTLIRYNFRCDVNTEKY